MQQPAISKLIRRPEISTLRDLIAPRCGKLLTVLDMFHVKQQLIPSLNMNDGKEGATAICEVVVRIACRLTVDSIQQGFGPYADGVPIGAGLDGGGISMGVSIPAGSLPAAGVLLYR